MHLLAPIANFGIEAIYLIGFAALMLLPESPFEFTPLDWGVFGQAVGLVFPVGSMFVHMTAIVTACGMYYVVRWALRLIKAIQ